VGASTSNDWTRIGTMNRERGALLRPDVETATRGAMLRAPTDRFMESGGQLACRKGAFERDLT